ncbi:hypothetical protein GCM10010404_09060 [Nonomuraea africana]
MVRPPDNAVATTALARIARRPTPPPDATRRLDASPGFEDGSDAKVGVGWAAGGG